VGDVFHDTGLKETDEEKELQKTSGGDRIEGGESVGDISEGLSRVASPDQSFNLLFGNGHNNLESFLDIVRS
jgi:hypothetical protein